jgi:hypothetical protein
MNQLAGRQAFVLGSGPGSAPPPGGFAGWFTMTVNASQILLAAWGNQVPDYTIFNNQLLTNQRKNCVAARSLLKGKRTRNLVVIKEYRSVWRTRLTRLPFTRLRLFLLQYRYARFSTITPRQRSAIVSSVLGADIPEQIKPSSGIFLAFLALHLGASRVLMSGFSLTQDGHAYNTLNLRREHAGEDRELLARAIAAGLPIYTNSREFSLESNVPFLGK